MHSRDQSLQRKRQKHAVTSIRLPFWERTQNRSCNWYLLAFSIHIPLPGKDRTDIVHKIIRPISIHPALQGHPGAGGFRLVAFISIHPALQGPRLWLAFFRRTENFDPPCSAWLRDPLRGFAPLPACGLPRVCWSIWARVCSSYQFNGLF